MDFDHRIDRDNVEVLKSESHAYRCRVKERFFNKSTGSFTECNQLL